jgi:hypothetical protein
VAFWQTLLASFGGSAILLALVVFLGRSLVSLLLEKDVEKFKSDLQAAAAMSTEKLRADLKIIAVEHEIRFSRLHAKRADVLAELHQLIVHALWEAEIFASPFGFAGDDKKEQYVKAMNAITSYYRFFEEHRIFIPAELCATLEDFAKKVRSPVIRFGTYVRIDGPTTTTLEKMHEVWDESYRAIKEGDISALRLSIEREFRKLLGAAEN